MTEQLTQYNEEVQRVLLSFMMSDPTLFARSRNIIEDEYFENKLRPAVRFIQDYSDQYKSLPTKIQVKATTGIDIEAVDQKTIEAHGNWYLDTVEAFCRFRAIENTILDGPELLKTGRYGEIEKRLRDAMIISLTRDLGSQYYSDPLARIHRLRDNSNLISSGWPSLDDKLDGGLSRGGLHIFCGGSGSGKSLWMLNLALNKVEEGLNVVYFTLELSEDLTDSRVDSMVTGMTKAEIFSNAHRAAAIISKKGKNSGDLTTKKFSEAGTTCNDLRAYLKEYRIQRGYDPDLICVDYLDLLYPNNAKIDAGNLFVKDKFVAEELRSIAGDYDIPMVTASQLNRQSVDSSEFDHAHIAGGISKINTADNVFAILFSTSMRERGEYELQFLKTRSAGSVGHKVKFAFDKATLRITERADGDDQTRGKTPPSDEMRQEMKAKTEKLHQGREVNMGSAPSVTPLKDGIAGLINNMKNNQKPEG